jgi:hypothetical protein
VAALNQPYRRTDRRRGSQATAFVVALVWTNVLFAQPAGFVERHWYDGARQRTVWMAPNEVALVFDPAAAPKTRSDAEQRAARSTPGAVLEKQQGLVSIIRLPDGIDADGPTSALRNESGVHHASPVFYEGGIGPDNALVLSGELIISFNAAMSDEALARFSAKYGFQLIKALDVLANTYVFDARSAGDTLALANTIFESGQVALAQPNWIRNATRR